MDKSIVKQYGAHLELPGGTVTPVAIVCDLTCESLEVLKERVSALLSGKARFEGAQSTVGSPGVTLIFHANFNRGETVLGWISPHEVPEHMTVQATIERLKEAAA
jgi:hypothetical protein